MPRTKQSTGASYQDLEGNEVQLSPKYAESLWVIKVTKKEGLDVEPYIIGFDKREAENILKHNFISGEVLYKPE